MELYEDSRVPTRQIDMRPRTPQANPGKVIVEKEAEKTDGKKEQKEEEKSFILVLKKKKRFCLESVKMAEQVDIRANTRPLASKRSKRTKATEGCAVNAEFSAD